MARRPRTRWTTVAKAGRERAEVGTWWGRPAELRPVSRGLLSLQAADQIRRRIVLGHLRPHRRLESQRVMARELGVSLPVVREAIAALVYAGLIEVRHGVGTFVAQRSRRARVVRVSRRRATRRELRDLRQAVEPAIARAAAARRVGAAQRGDIQMALYERMRASKAGIAGHFTDADFAFHEAVARASGNVLGVSVLRMTALALRPDQRAHARAFAEDERLARLHRALVDAIGNKRVTDAGRLAQAIAAIEASAPP